MHQPRVSSVLQKTGIAGVTLLELLVVLAIMALASAGVSLALRSAPGTQLEREAGRLAALLEAGRAASRASGRPVYWRPGSDGFVFEGLPPATLPGHWLAPGVRVQSLQGPGAAPVSALVLGPEPVLGPQRVDLSHTDAPDQSLSLVSDGLHPFTLQSSAPS